MRMIKTMKTSAVIAGLALATVAVPATAFATPVKTVGTYHVNAVSTLVMGASAKATITLNAKTDKVCYNVVTKGLVGVAAAHIHKGALKVNGPVAVGLVVGTFNRMGVSCVSAPAATIKAILANPQGYYFNVHTAKYPNGAARAQL
jgi:hypothetical protein